MAVSLADNYDVHQSDIKIVSHETGFLSMFRLVLFRPGLRP
jgi:hypothetical protein